MSFANVFARSDVEGGYPNAVPCETSKLSREIFQDLVRPLLPRMYQVCLAFTGHRQDAEDLLQQALVSAYMHRDSCVARDLGFSGWLYVIIRNEFYETWRKKKRRDSLWDKFLQHVGVQEKDTEVPYEDPEKQAMRNDTIVQLLAGMRRLNEGQRDVLVMCSVAEFSHDEAARLLGLPVGTVKSRHARALVAMRVFFQKCAA